MKLLPTLFACIGSIVAIHSAAADEPNRRALLVAVNGYTHHSDNDAKPLNTTPDVLALKSVLMAKWGFKETDIKILQTPEETTHKSIITWFQKFLVVPAKPGDIIFFHYSGHGATVKDPNRDGGVDQTLVPSDYSTTDSSNDIRGREITPLLVELEKPEHAPASITLSFDSCHSGSITRGMAPVRDYERKTDANAVQPAADHQKLAGGMFDIGLAAKKGYLIISACRADQVSEETYDDNQKYMGSLSYALSKALGEASSATTYRQVMDRVGSIMRAHGLSQEPQVEGSWEKELFSGKLAPADHTLIVDQDHDTKEPVLLAGFPMGVTAGSKYNLYRKDTDPKTAPAIATAVVSHVDATHAQLKCELKDNIAKSDLRGAIAVITERNYTPAVTRVDLSALAAHPQSKPIQTALDDLSANTDMKAAAAGFENNWDLRVLPASKALADSPILKPAIGANPPPESLVIEKKDGSLLQINTGGVSTAALPNDGSLASQIALAVSHFVSWRTVNDLHNPDGNQVPPIEVKYVPCEIDKTTKRVIRDLPLTYSAGNQLEVQVGTALYAMVRNMGTKPAYVTILDLQSDGIVNAMWPAAGEQTSNVVPPDQMWHKTLAFADDHTPVYAIIGPPIGPESVRVIATLEPSNFSFLDNTSRSRGVGPTDPLSRLLNQAATGRGPTFGVPATGWNVFGFNYTILPEAKSQ